MLAFDDILSQHLITPYFQPLYDLNTGELFGHEALARGPADSRFFYPDALFTTALACNKLHELEILCRQQSLQRFSELALPGKLFLNVSASLLSSPYHQTGMTLSILAERKLQQENIVIELSEQHPYDHEGLTSTAVNHYRQMGFKVAIDDLGVGYSGLRLWSELQPELVKIDKHFVHNLDQDSVKREFVRSIVAIANRLHCQIIAEGIETEAELNQLMELGVTIGQGYLLGRPTPNPQITPNQLLLDTIAARRANIASDETVLSLTKPIPAIQKSQRLHEALALFKQSPQLFALPILEGEIPLGVLRRHQLHELFSMPYGRALYENKPVTQLLSQDVLIVEEHVSLANVSHQLTNQDASMLNNEIVVVKEGHYVGMGSLRDLLKRITELKIQNATYSNPLTQLPGNVPITRAVSQRLSTRTDFYIAYFDLNDFKPFNDHFGYAKGDDIIKLLGQLIVRYAVPETSVIGHIGGDDFVILFDQNDWQDCCKAILADFSQQIVGFYSEDIRQSGGTWSANRQGEIVFQPLLSLAIGVVHPDVALCGSHHEVAELAAMAKKIAKQKGGNQLFFYEQRHLQAPFSKAG